MGTGVSDSYPPAFQFPPVGEVFDWPGPELVKIPHDRPGANDHEGPPMPEKRDPNLKIPLDGCIYTVA